MPCQIPVGTWTGLTHGEETGATSQGQHLSGFLPAPSGGQGLPLLFTLLPQSRTEHWSLMVQLIVSSCPLNAQDPVFCSAAPLELTMWATMKRQTPGPLLPSLLHCPGNNDITLRVGLRPPELHKQQWGHESTAASYF